MHFELTKDFIAYLKSLIEVQDVEKILECFSDAHPADIADILEQLTNEEANYVFLQFHFLVCNLLFYYIYMLYFLLLLYFVQLLNLI